MGWVAIATLTPGINSMMVSTASLASWKNSKYPGMNIQIFPRVTSPMNGIPEGFKCRRGSFEPNLSTGDDSTDPRSTVGVTNRIPATLSISCLSGGGSCVSHSITLPPASCAILSALSASAMSRKQKRHFSPKFRQLQCQSPYRPCPHLLSHTCLETAKQWTRTRPLMSVLTN